MENSIQYIKPGSFVSENHFYPKALNATIHPMVNFFMNLSKERIISRYCHLNPMVNKDKMEEINERFSHKNKAALANDLLENKLAYLSSHSGIFLKK